MVLGTGWPWLAEVKSRGYTQNEDNETAMSMEAEVVAIGPFSPKVADFMEYPQKYYRDTREGVPVLRILFQVYNGTNVSTEMARCLGVLPWDFNTHHVNANMVDIDKLRQMFDSRDVDAFLALRDAGFQFYFMPNG